MSTTIDSILSQLQSYSSSASSSTTSSTSSTTSSSYTPQLELLVQTFKKTQQSKIDTLKNKQNELTKKQTFFNNLNTRINTLLSNVDKFTIINANDKFISRSITSSDNSYATVSAGKDAILGVSTLKINRLATADNLISQRLNINDTSNLTGQIQVKIKSGTIGEDFQPITIDFGENPLTNEEAMKKIASAINARTDLKITASVIKDTENTARMTFIAKETGKENAIYFDNESDNAIIKFLGFDTISNRTNSINTEESARYQISKIDELNSEVIINGIKVVRNSNTLKDVLPGATINLLKPTEADKTITLTTEIDTKTITNLIQPLLDSYNNILNFIKNDTNIRKSESSVANLYSTLRNLSTSQMKEVSPNDTLTPKYLTDIGIKINNDGTLSISDTEKLKKVLQEENGYLKVAELFTTKKDPNNPTKPYGFAERLYDAIKSYVGYTDDKGNKVEGIIKTKTYALNLQINSYNQRIKDVENRIDQQANTLRKEYENTLKVYLEAQSQYNYLYAYSTLTSRST